MRPVGVGRLLLWVVTHPRSLLPTAFTLVACLAVLLIPVIDEMASGWPPSEKIERHTGFIDFFQLGPRNHRIRLDYGDGVLILECGDRRMSAPRRCVAPERREELEWRMVTVEWFREQAPFTGCST